MIKMYCTGCQKEYDLETYNFKCKSCGEPIEVELIKQGTISKNNPLSQNILERYIDFYPYFKNLSRLNEYTLGEGYTPLIEAKTLSRKYRIRNIYFKNESQNPTWSFKDRGTLTGALRAFSLGYKKIGTVSTGNMATSVAAYGSKFNLDTYVFVKKDILDEKLEPIAIYNPKLIKVDGDYGKLYDESFKIGKDKGIYFINSDVTFRVEGYKTLSFEICEQLKFETPDYIIIPTSAGGNLRGIEKGFLEFKEAGLINKIPKIIAVEAKGCSPLYEAYKNKSVKVEKFKKPNTIAGAINNPYPPSGNQVLRTIKDKKGYVIAVTDSEIIEAQKEMASEGIFGQPASATSLAALKKLQRKQFFKETDDVVCIVTASGLKDTSILKKHNLQYKIEKIDELYKTIK